MKKFIVHGGKKLSGEVTVSGNKNSVLPIIAASILTKEELTLTNVPDILDVKAMLKIIEYIGGTADYANGTLKLKTEKIINSKIPKKLCSECRTSFLFTGPLLVRTGEAEICSPGGDVIGRRRLDAHFYGLSSLGAEIISNKTPFIFKTENKLEGRELFLDEASVTATEHIMMTAVLAKGETIIRNSAAEPHVAELGELLNRMGANISGLGSNNIIITGVDSLKGVKHEIHGDHIEAGSFLALAAATKGEITIHGIKPGHFWMTRRVFEKFGIEFEMNENSIFLSAKQDFSIRPELGNAVPIISDGPWPQYPSDMMSCTLVMATQAKGTVLFFEKMFESRLYFVDRLIQMGGNAIVCDPHRVVISSPAKLQGITMDSPDIRAGMALVIAALCAKGKSTINNANMILRGYCNIVEKIQSLGGNIELVD